MRRLGTVLVAALAISAAWGFAGCGHEPKPYVEPEEFGLGKSTRPYGGVPDYLKPPEEQAQNAEGPPEAPPDERIPVAGNAWHPTAGTLDTLRLDLAGIDAAAIALRRSPVASAGAEPPAQTIARLSTEVERVASVRPDIAVEADELRAIGDKLETAVGPRRAHLLNRIEELTDLIRLQIRATT